MGKLYSLNPQSSFVGTSGQIFVPFAAGNTARQSDRSNGVNTGKHNRSIGVSGNRKIFT